MRSYWLCSVMCAVTDCVVSCAQLLAVQFDMRSYWLHSVTLRSYWLCSVMCAVTGCAVSYAQSLAAQCHMRSYWLCSIIRAVTDCAVLHAQLLTVQCHMRSYWLRSVICTVPGCAVTNCTVEDRDIVYFKITLNSMYYIYSHILVVESYKGSNETWTFLLEQINL